MARPRLTDEDRRRRSAAAMARTRERRRARTSRTELARQDRKRLRWWEHNRPPGY